MFLFIMEGLFQDYERSVSGEGLLGCDLSFAFL